MADSITVHTSPDVGGKDKTNQFPFFLRLPAEIRNKIYRYSLVEYPQYDRIEGLVQPPLTRINKQVRSEALPIYYGENKFVLRCIPASSVRADAEDWPNFVRMFRMFKAGRSDGRGTGSLRFIQNIECQFRNVPRSSIMGFKFIKGPDPSVTSGRHMSPVHGPDVVECGYNSAWCDSEWVTRFVGDFLVNQGFSRSVMHRSSTRRLVSTIVMIAKECIDVPEASEFETTGQLWVYRGSIIEQEQWNSD